MRCSSIDILSMYSCVSRNFTRDRQSCRIYKRRVISPIVCVTEFASWLSANYVLMCSILYAQTICTRRLLSCITFYNAIWFCKIFQTYSLSCYHVFSYNVLWTVKSIMSKSDYISLLRTTPAGRYNHSIIMRLFTIKFHIVSFTQWISATFWVLR